MSGSDPPSAASGPAAGRGVDPLAELLGESEAIRGLRTRLRRIAARGVSGRTPPVLLRGETGTGKGLVASVLHRAGPRTAGPFLAVNCAAIPAPLVEAEFFGYERGAFTDARQAKPGLFEAADRGTLFLDEIGLLPWELQGKLLTVLDDRRIRRLGATRSQSVDVWLIAATSANLETEVRDGRFREDLFHRLSVVPLHLPPLREREGDVLLLAEAFLVRTASEYRLPHPLLTTDAKQALLGHPWSGNVRELANVLERTVLLSDSDIIRRDDLHLEVSRTIARDQGKSNHAPNSGDPPDNAAGDASRQNVRDSVQEYERRRLLQALEGAEWNISRAADVLGIPRTSLRYRMDKLRLQPPRLMANRHGIGTSAGATEQAADAGVPAPERVGELSEARLTFLRLRATAGGATVAGAATGWGIDRLIEKAEWFGGFVTARDATGFDVVFGLEPAEDTPSRAANAALAVEKLVERLREHHPMPDIVMVLHTTSCRIAGAPGGARPVSESLDVIERELSALVARGQPGVIAVGADTASLIKRRFKLEPFVEDGHPAREFPSR